MKKFKPLFIDVTEHPTLIIGECPGNQKPETEFCWENNRSANFMYTEVLYQLKNIIMTNASMYKNSTSKKNLQDGFLDIEKLIYTHRPRMIILLGEVAVKELKTRIRIIYPGPLYNFNHPSFVLRFQYRERLIYASIIRKVIQS